MIGNHVGIFFLLQMKSVEFHCANFKRDMQPS